MKEKITRTYSYENLKAEWDWEDALDKEFPIDAFFKRLYRSIRAFIYNIPDMPRDGYRKIKRGIQRAYRGWSDEDCWAGHYYLAKVTYEMLLRLKNTKHGIPLDMFPESAKLREDGNFTNAQEAIAINKWNKTLDKIIYAYKLNVDISNGDREIYAPQMPEDVRNEYKCLSQKEESQRLLGMNLFAKHFFSLLD